MKNTAPAKWEKHPNLAAILFLGGLIVLFYHRVILGNSIFVFVDASRFFYPLWKWGAGVLHQGFIPLWNPDAQFGTPYFADPQMAYAYPPVPLLYSFLSPTNAFAALIILHHFWALLGFWFFARGQGYSAKASLLGSLIFGFSLHVVCSSWTPVALMTISWVPWVFLAMEKILQRQKGGLLYLSFTCAMQLAAGYPVLAYLTALTLLLRFAWKMKFTVIARSDRRIGGRLRQSNPSLNTFMWIVLAGLIALAYNLAWGLPFAELFRLSNYQNGANRFHDLGWLDLATALNPFIQGYPLGHDYHGPHYWVSTYFLGLPTLCLLIWGGYRRLYQKAPWPIFLILLVLSLGVLGAGKALQYILPGYSLVIHSGYWISLLALWAAWMAMETADSLLENKAKKNETLFWIGMVMAIYFLSVALGAPLLSFPLWLSLGLLVSMTFIRLGSTRWLFLMAAIFLSLGASAYSLNILLDRSYYEEPPKVLTQLTKEGRLFFSPPVMKEAGRLQGESMAQAYEMAKQKLYPDWPLTFGKEEAPIYNTLQLNDSFVWTYQAFRHSLKHSRSVLDYLNIRYVFGKNQFKDFKKISGSDDSVEVSENPTVLPKWFTVEKAIAEGSSIDDDFLKADKESLDYGKQCFVADPAKAGIYRTRQVAVQTHSSNRLVLNAPGKGRALVISSETGYPGWKVRVEGKEKNVERINHSFRGVLLEEGETRVIFDYEPVTFRLGLFYSLLICGLWTSLLFQRVRV